MLLAIVFILVCCYYYHSTGETFEIPFTNTKIVTGSEHGLKRNVQLNLHPETDFK